jgi:hypothetical protein
VLILNHSVAQKTLVRTTGKRAVECPVIDVTIWVIVDGHMLVRRYAHWREALTAENTLGWFQRSVARGPFAARRPRSCWSVFRRGLGLGHRRVSGRFMKTRNLAFLGLPLIRH